MTTWIEQKLTTAIDYLKRETGDFLLRENGGYLEEQNEKSEWGYQGLHTTAWSDESKPTFSFYFKIDDTYDFLIDNTYKLIIDSGTQPNWSYPVKN